MRIVYISQRLPSINCYHCLLERPQNSLILAYQTAVELVFHSEKWVNENLNQASGQNCSI